jgi:hypothetical protein
MLSRAALGNGGMIETSQWWHRGCDASLFGLDLAVHGMGGW